MPAKPAISAAEKLGRDYLAVTDHSPRLRVAYGLNRERLVAQWAEMERVQEERDIRVLRGIEVDILGDGSLDHAQVVSSTRVVDGETEVLMVGHNVDSTYRSIDDALEEQGFAGDSDRVLRFCKNRLESVDVSWRGLADHEVAA